MSDIEDDLKEMIIEVLDLEDVSAGDIDTHEPLFVDGLGLDSIDALEIGVAMQKRYGIRIQSDSEENRKHFASVRALADLVRAREVEGE